MSRSIWKTLGVKAGSDRDTIRRAYTAKLRVTNPEDDPEGFMALREAYETALQRLRWSEAADDVEEPEAAETVAAVEDARPRAGSRPRTVAAPDPDAALHAELAAAQRALADGLTGPWVCDDQGLRTRLDAVIGHPLIETISVRERIELWLADIIARHLPRADPLIEPALRAFGWNHPGFRATARPIAVVLARLDVWRFVNAAEAPYGDLHQGWLALTRARRPEWLMRAGALVPPVAAQVRRILYANDGHLPGVDQWFNLESERWWRDYLSASRISGMTLLLAPLLAGLFIWLAAAAPLPAPVFVPLLGLALLVPWLWARFVEAPHDARNRWRDPRPTWLRLGWIGLLAVVPIVAVLLPPDAVGLCATVVLAGALAIWTGVAVSPNAEPIEQPFQFWIRKAIWPLALLIASRGLLSSPRLLVLAVTGTAAGLAAMRGGETAARALQQRLPRLASHVAVLPVLVAAGVAIVWLPQLVAPPGADLDELLFTTEMALIVAALLIGLGGLLVPNGRVRSVLAIGWILMGIAVVFPLDGLRQPASPPRVEAVPNELPSLDEPISPRSPTTDIPLLEPSRAQAPALLTPAKDWIDLGRLQASAFMHEGAYQVGFTVYVESDGSVSRCDVSLGTRIPAIDDMICAMLVKRLHFIPATDDSGDPVASHYSDVIAWRMTKQFIPAQPSPAALPAFHAPVECAPDTRGAGRASPPVPCERSKWIDGDDYPDAARRKHQQGTVSVELDVDTAGLVTGCIVMASSGHASLDTATCSLLKSRARFLPALDEGGAAVAGPHRTRMTWELAP